MPFKSKKMIKKIDTVGKGKDFSKNKKKVTVNDLKKKGEDMVAKFAKHKKKDK